MPVWTPNKSEIPRRISVDEVTDWNCRKIFWCPVFWNFKTFLGEGDVISRWVEKDFVQVFLDVSQGLYKLNKLSRPIAW